MTHRLFVAIRPPEFVRDALIDAMEALEGAHWVGDEQLHLTLRFVGEVERPVANELAEALAGIVWPAFPMDIDGVSHFARKGRPAVLWARVPPSPELEGLRQKVERACELAGLARETRRFTPHVTLARLRGRTGLLAPWLARHGGVRAGPWTVDRFALVESHLSPRGAHHQTVAEFALCD